MALNRITLQGRITKDIELRHTNSGKAVTTITLAVDRDRKDQDGNRGVDFIDVVAWGGTAEFLHNYFGKGRMAVVDGRLELRDWTDKNGNNRRSAQVVADSVYFCGSKQEGGEAPQTPYTQTPYQKPTPGAFEDYGGDDDIPF